MQIAGQKDLASRVIGLIVFLVGVTLLLIAYAAAYKLFTSPSAGLVLIQPGSPQSPTASNLSSAALTLFARLAWLLIMTLGSSLAAARGIQLYLACERPLIIENLSQTKP